jgi:hypothetical protein
MKLFSILIINCHAKGDLSEGKTSICITPLATVLQITGDDSIPKHLAING